MTIKLFVTGGTIDKRYNELNGTLSLDGTQIPDMLAQGRCLADISVETILLKDSLDIHAEDRDYICTHCLRCDSTQIVITHGTDTLSETAAVLAQKVHNKTIVLLGAMIPFVFKGSDALFNLGGAITAVQCLPVGVYINMNGQIFDWDQVIKNTQKGIFQVKI
ncbi:asparaginase domain-containing protein [Candidatus Venteria ishoeyi]|uniref:Putative L-asparaginase periplasmic n=1 Tax=Candidatus Venteria ishoeyi TaxID=1899563 RepID=A0A1H6FII2_9GAMM|nr:asparaginase domain-containing protein [Candidatus Venteria ishoeyi]SEH08865.1 putative L-asparaginase periplasmic precursor [Candidatus Venteria ishoeyi]